MRTLGTRGHSGRVSDYKIHGHNSEAVSYRIPLRSAAGGEGQVVLVDRQDELHHKLCHLRREARPCGIQRVFRAATQMRIFRWLQSVLQVYEESLDQMLEYCIRISGRSDNTSEEQTCGLCGDGLITSMASSRNTTVTGKQRPSNAQSVRATRVSRVATSRYHSVW